MFIWCCTHLNDVQKWVCDKKRCLITYTGEKSSETTTKIVACFPIYPGKKCNSASYSLFFYFIDCLPCRPPPTQQRENVSCLLEYLVPYTVKKKVRRFYGKIPSNQLPVHILLFLRASACRTFLEIKKW